MTKFHARLLVVLAVLALVLLAMPAPAHARAILIGAAPAPNQTLDRLPEEVRLTFNTPLDPTSYTLTVVDAIGVHIDNADAHLAPGDPTVLVVSLPLLEEGLYTVTYTVTDLATETTTSDTYQFALNFPTPQVRLVSPPNGAGYETDSVKVEVDTGNFDLSYWQHFWRLYLDGDPITTTRQPGYDLHDLEQGVHELRAVLVDPDGAELHDTRTTTYFAIGKPDPEAEELAMAAAAPGDPGLTLSRGQTMLLAIAVVTCLGVGVLLGRRPT